MSDSVSSPTPGEDPVGERLRAFGVQNAPTASSLPPVEGIHRRGGLRRRNQRLATALVTVAVAAIVGGVVIVSQLGNTGDETILPATQTPTPTPSTGPTTPTVSSPSPNGTRIDLGGKATMLVPEGWSSKVTSALLDSGKAVTVPLLCLNDNVANGPSVNCDLEVQWGAVTVGREGQQAWAPGQVGGWYHRSDALPCFLSAGDRAAMGQGDIMQVDQAPTKSLGPVGSKTAEVYRYEIQCTQGRGFTSTMWWLPTTQLRFHDIVGNPRTTEILESVRFVGEG